MFINIVEGLNLKEKIDNIYFTNKMPKIEIKEYSDKEYDVITLISHKKINGFDVWAVREHYHKHHYYKDRYMLDYDYSQNNIYIKMEETKDENIKDNKIIHKNKNR